ncbi:hypothetical protein PQX77_002282 [Marasmius sp. AFHP31]|nr:hypothetical protein PQX77_002282 [Marasmius sp. AFHP31]
MTTSASPCTPDYLPTSIDRDDYPYTASVHDFEDFLSFLNDDSTCGCDQRFLCEDLTTSRLGNEILRGWTDRNAYTELKETLSSEVLQDPTDCDQRIPIYSSRSGLSFSTSTKWQGPTSKPYVRPSFTSKPLQNVLRSPFLNTVAPERRRLTSKPPVQPLFTSEPLQNVLRPPLLNTITPERRRLTSKPPIRPLFTFEPLENVLRSPRPSTVAPERRRPTSACPWHWSSVSIIEKWLGTSLSDVSIPNLEENGFLYCYRIEGGSPYRDSELYKVGRTIDYAKREGQWRRQCHSQTQTWFEPVPVVRCHLTERLVHLKLDRMCLSRPRKKCNDCLKRHQEIFEMLETRGKDVWKETIVPLILEIDLLLDQAGWIETD